jgi:hypothetical protein
MENALHRLFYLLLVGTVALLPGVASAQHEAGSTPIAGMPGGIQSVARSFVRFGGPKQGETYFLAFNVTEYEVAALENLMNSGSIEEPEEIQGQFEREAGRDVRRLLASGGIPLEATEGMGERQIVSTPLIGDFTTASRSDSADGSISLAQLITGWSCGTNYCLSSMLAIGIHSEPLADLILVAEKLYLSRGNTTMQASSEYRSEGPWARLPGFEHLPTGFVFEREWVVVGPDEATPLAGQRE